MEVNFEYDLEETFNDLFSLIKTSLFGKFYSNNFLKKLVLKKWKLVKIKSSVDRDAYWNIFLAKRSEADQKIVGSSLQPIGVIITGNLFIKAPCWELQQILLVSAARSRSKNFPVFSDMLVCCSSQSQWGIFWGVIIHFYSLKQRETIRTLMYVSYTEIVPAKIQTHSAVDLE